MINSNSAELKEVGVKTFNEVIKFIRILLLDIVAPLVGFILKCSLDVIKKNKTIQATIGIAFILTATYLIIPQVLPFAFLITMLKVLKR